MSGFILLTSEEQHLPIHGSCHNIQMLKLYKQKCLWEPKFAETGMDVLCWNKSLLLWDEEGEGVLIVEQ